MARLHLVVGYRTRNRSESPTPIYLGNDADAARTAQNDAVRTGGYAVADRFQPHGPHTRYAVATAPVASVDQPASQATEPPRKKKQKAPLKEESVELDAPTTEPPPDE
jgi:hypothetical protein